MRLGIFKQLNFILILFQLFEIPQDGGKETDMNIQEVPFCTIDWNSMTPTVHQTTTRAKLFIVD